MERFHVFGVLLAAISLTASATLSAQTPPDQYAHAPCPVTRRPDKAFSPPFPYLPRPPDPVSFWYGTQALWTQIWAPPPWTPWKPQEAVRMYWASDVKSNEEQPTLVVSIRRVDTDEPPQAFTAPDTVAYTPKRFGMIASVTFPSAGCWQVTGQYLGKTLKYVVEVEPASSPRNYSEGPQSQPSPPSSKANVFGPETQPRGSPGVPRAVYEVLSYGNDVVVACGGKFGPCTTKQLKRLHQSHLEQKEHFAVARKLLLQHGVPFDPDILIERALPGEVVPVYKLKPVLDQMPEMKQILWTDFLTGVVMADTLYVPLNVKLGPGPIIVIVNHLVSETFCQNTMYSTSGGNPFGTDGFYMRELGTGRHLGMSLDKALKLNGLSREQFPGKDHLPPFSVIRDLDLPKTDCKKLYIDMNAGGQPTPPQPWPDPPEPPKH